MAVVEYEKQRVQVGTTMVYDKIPRYKTVLERVRQYKTVRYVKYYRTTRPPHLRRVQVHQQAQARVWHEEDLQRLQEGLQTRSELREQARAGWLQDHRDRSSEV